jgi:ABC-type sugar transport system substrate-binding protein
LKLLRGNWTEESGYRTLQSWLKLSIARSSGFSAVISQNDAMLIGARRAFTEITDSNERERWIRMPMLGCDGQPQTGQVYIRRGLITATIATPPVASLALELYVQHCHDGKPIPERTLATSESWPELKSLTRQG